MLFGVEGDFAGGGGGARGTRESCREGFVFVAPEWEARSQPSRSHG